MQSPPFSIVVVAASMGGPRALSELVRALPAEMPAPIVIVQHLPSMHDSSLPCMLAGRSKLPVMWATTGVMPQPGHIYLAQPGQHLEIDDSGAFDLVQGEPVLFVRPAADLLFRSAARCHKSGVLAVVLTGRGTDGTAGAQAVRAKGGVVVVQDPRDCVAPNMPASVLGLSGADFVLPLRTIPSAITTLLTVPGALPMFGLLPARN